MPASTVVSWVMSCACPAVDVDRQADTGFMLLVSSGGLSPDTARSIRHASVHEGIGGWAIREARLVVIERYGSDPEAMDDLAGEGISAAMAAPVREHGAVIGSLVVGSRAPDRRYRASEQEGLLVFAEHAGLALSNAHTQTALDQAFHDSLTGLPNRALFLDRLEHASAVAARELDRMGLLFVDLDGFKTVNDSLGHAAGDELLSAVATRLRASLRAADTPARLGGDEFAVLVEGVTRTADAVVAAQRILDGLREPFLRDYPFDVLKLDRAFVEHIGREPSADGKAAALVRTILALGDDLSLTTLAEGIERHEQLTQLRALGCRLGQGYLFSRPVPADEATALLPWT